MNFMEGNFPEARDVSDVFFSFDFKDTSTSTSGSASCFSRPSSIDIMMLQS